MNKAFYEIDKVSLFLSPNKVILGKGTVQQIGAEVKALGGKNPLIVTDEGVVKAGLVAQIENALTAAGLKYGIFDKVEPEPLVRFDWEFVPTKLPSRGLIVVL